MRAAAAFRTGGAGTTALPMASLMATAAVRPRIIEVGIFNTTATAVAICLKRISVAGGTHAAITEVQINDDSQTPVATVVDVDTGTAPTLGAAMRQASLGAAVGSGVIWTFGDAGLIIPAGTTQGLAIVCATGTSQICDVYFDWIE